VCGEAYVASRLGLSTGNMPLTGPPAAAPLCFGEPHQGSAQPIEKTLSTNGLRAKRLFAVLASRRRSARVVVDTQYGGPSLCAMRPLAIDRHDREVVISVGHRIASGAITEFEIDDVVAGLVHEAMGVAASCLETGAHAGLKRRPADVGEQGRAPFEDLNELVLLRVRMAQGA
jgi:hypothetical protein